MAKRDRKATEGQRYATKISVILPGRDKPESVFLSMALRDAVEKAARLDNRSMSNYLQVLAIKDVTQKGIYDPEKDSNRLSEVVHTATKLDTRPISNYFRALAIRDVTEKGLYDPLTAPLDNEIGSNGSTKP